MACAPHRTPSSRAAASVQRCKRVSRGLHTSPTRPSPAASSGWDKRVDPSSGRTFYIDHINKRTSWEHPGSSSTPSYAQPPRSQPSSYGGVGGGGGGGGGGGADVDRDAELARKLAAQWEAQDESAPSESSSAMPSAHGKEKEGWASDADAVQCFLTGTRFTMVQRKHHCRYCGQTFVSDGEPLACDRSDGPGDPEWP